MSDVLRILIVDDEPGMRHAVARVLERHGQVRFARTAAEALDAVRTEPIDLAFVDVRLPDGDGFDLMAGLQALRPGLDVVVMTGSVQDMDAKLVRTLRERAFFFLPKPFGRELLLTVFDRWRERRELTRRDREQRRRLQAHLDEARRFQASLLPQASARVGGVALHARFEPCDELSGDLYDFAPVGAGGDGVQGVAVLVADVSGHGVAAAMLSGVIKAAFQSAHADAFAPGAVLQRIRDALQHLEDDRFVTAFAGRLRPAERVLEYASAGHHDGLLWRRDGSIETLAHTGPLICSAIPSASWRTERRALGCEDQLLLSSDGIEETRGDDGLFGRERLLAELQPERRGFALLDAILDAVQRHAGGRPRDDDHTLLLARPVDAEPQRE
ncbi:MAG: SpoIIE family protein phosphatase [Planctomycetes bacterium]|nr:SpoIIE family protein phosphatase [Planctomycetota bacterium]